MHCTGRNLHFRHIRGVEFFMCKFDSHSAKKAAVIRASDDFFPRDPASHTIHVASVAYNTIFIGEFMVPDWDMFHVRIPSSSNKFLKCLILIIFT